MMPTLRARLAMISTIVFGLLLAILGVASYQVLARWLDADATERLNELTDGLHGYLHIDADTVSVAFDANDNDQVAFVHEATRFYQVYDVETGRLLVESPVLTSLGLNFTASEVQGFGAHPQSMDIETDHGHLRISNSVRKVAGHQYLLQVGMSLDAVDGALRRYRMLLLLCVPAGLLIGGAAAWWVAGFSLLPLLRVAEAADRIDLKTLERRLPIRGVNDELDLVAGAFNEALGRLEHAVGEMRQFSAALAHELRTPLAALRGEIELSLRAAGSGHVLQRTLASQIEEIDRLTKLIDHILTLARAESGQIRLDFAPVNMSQLAASLAEQLEPLAEARSIQLRCEAPDEVVVEGDAGWLQRLLLNLLDNALKFTNASGRIVIRVSREDQTARIEIRDTGIGLSAEDAERVFERFFRADPARSSSIEGAGLGLSLVRWIAGQHGGRVSVQSRLGEGSTFTVTLPLWHAQEGLRAEG